MQIQSQHTADATALIAPLASVWATGSSVLSVILTLMGIVWYSIQIGKWVSERRALRRATPRVEETHVDESKAG